ncbi:MAG: replicative DNA helicase [Ignavibacteria bacterium]|nr:replicative DNA helicase [Ignavibacteria bacterium]
MSDLSIFSETRGNSGNLPPHAIEMEMAVLGAMMIDREAVYKGMNILNDEVFYAKKHKLIFQTIRKLFSENEAIDHLTVFNELKRIDKAEEAGGAAYLIELTQNLDTAANFEYYARVVLERSILRELISTSNKISSDAHNAKDDALTILDRAERCIFEITERHIKKSYVDLRKAVNDAMEYIDSIHSKDFLKEFAVPTGYYDMDNLLGGFQNSDMIILAARPSMGKTAFALNLARNAADHVPVALFSLEMNTQQLVLRLLSAEAQVESQGVRTGKLPPNKSQKLARGAAKLVEIPMYIDDTPALSVLEITAKARRLKNEQKIGFIVIDYLQLMQSHERMDSREREISHISRSLKALAKELNLPILALAQLNRAVESRQDKKPQLSDLRESGSIEQDADVVMFIHRPEYYGMKVDKDGTSLENVAEIIVAKHRNGPTGDVKLTFRKDFGRFESAELQRRYDELPQSTNMPPEEDFPI